MNLPTLENNPDGCPTGVPVGHERRATHQAMARWAAVQASGRVSTIADFVPPETEELKRQHLLLKADSDPRFSVFILCGESVLFDLGGDPTGMTLPTPLPDGIRADMCRSFADTLRRGEPVLEDGAYRASDGAEVRYRSVFMPITGDGVLMPDYVFGAFGSRRFDAAA